MKLKRVVTGSNMTALTTYNKAIRKSKYVPWKNCCDDIKDVSTSAKLIVKDRSSNLNAINLKNGRYPETEKKDSLRNDKDSLS